MEIDPINIAREVTKSVDSDRADGTTTPIQKQQVDFSHEHTNGRMFEQAVQNANMTHETSSPPELALESDAKIDAGEKPTNDKPLILNDKDPRSGEDDGARDDAKRNFSGKEALIEAFKVRHMKVKLLSTLSKDLIVINGQKIDEHLKMINHHSQPINPEDKEISFNSSQANISFNNKRVEIEKIGEATYEDILRIEDELNNRLDDTLVRGLNQAAFGKEVALRLLD